MSEDKRFYVYAYLDPFELDSFLYLEILFNNKPFYIGKGCNLRKLRHLKEAEKILRFNEIYDTKNRKINKIISIIKKIRYQ